MAIRIVTGNPGAGKTYFIMSHLLKKYFERDRVLQDYMPKSDVCIITNVDEIKLNTYSLIEMIAVAGGLEKFFNVEYQKGLLKRWPRIVYIIDEAGKFFGKELKSGNVLFLFQYHRHLGLDFYLICPNLVNINREIVGLSEYIVHARSRSSRITSGFTYDKMFEGEKAGTITLQKNKEIFRLYKSMDKAETEKVGSFIRKYFVFSGIVSLVACIVFFGAIGHLLGAWSGKKGKVKSQVPGSVVESVKKVEVKEVKKELAEPVRIIGVEVPVDPRGIEDLEDYTKVQSVVTHDGKKLFFTQDGRFYNEEMAGEILKKGFRIGGDIYLKRVGAGAVRAPSPSPTPPRAAPVENSVQRPVVGVGAVGKTPLP